MSRVVAPPPSRPDENPAGSIPPTVTPAPRASAATSAARQFLGYAWGMLAHPRATIDTVAAESSVRWAVIVGSLGVVQVWGNMLLHAAFGYSWLGSRPLLSDPTYVGGFGYLRVSADEWLPVFAALMPVLALYQLTVVPGITHLFSKLWGGQGSFEQMVNVLALATMPSLAIGWLSEWLTSVPLDLLTGSAYFYADAMAGRFGPTLQVLWTTYAIAVYLIPWTWEFVLGVVGIHRVQRIPLWAATFVMLVGFSLSMLITTTFVR